MDKDFDFCKILSIFAPFRVLFCWLLARWGDNLHLSDFIFTNILPYMNELQYRKSTAVKAKCGRNIWLV